MPPRADIPAPPNIAPTISNLIGRMNCQCKYCKNLLKVHARRHPQKRLYVLDENNANSFDDKKNSAFSIMKSMSQQNIQSLHNKTGKFWEYSDLKKELTALKVRSDFGYDLVVENPDAGHIKDE